MRDSHSVPLLLRPVFARVRGMSRGSRIAYELQLACRNDECHSNIVANLNSYRKPKSSGSLIARLEIKQIIILLELSTRNNFEFVKRTRKSDISAAHSEDLLRPVSARFTQITAPCAVAHGDRYICTIHRDVKQRRNIRNVNTSLPTIVRRGKKHNSNKVPDAPCRITSPALFPPIIFPILRAREFWGEMECFSYQFSQKRQCF